MNIALEHGKIGQDLKRAMEDARATMAEANIRGLSHINDEARLSALNNTGDNMNSDKKQ